MTAAMWAMPMLPLIVGTALLFAGRLPARIGGAIAIPVGIVTGLLTLIATIVVARQRPTVDQSWVPQLDMNLTMRVDGINIPLLLLCAGVTTLVLVQALAQRPPAGTRTSYAGCVLIACGGAMLAFATSDMVVFFIAFEMVLIPMWFLIARFGDPQDVIARDRAARLFILYSVLGSTLMLVGILTAVHAAGTSDMHTFAARVPLGDQVLVAVLMVTGLAIKVPIWPLHSWLPAAHTAAPTGGSMLLAAVLLKLGTYGIVRMVVPLHHGWSVIAPVVACFAVIGMLWAGLICLVEPAMKRVIAWSSIAHMGFVVLGLASGTMMGVQAALFGNVAHGVIAALLFAVVGGVKARWGGDDLRVPHLGLRDGARRLGFALLIGLAAALGLPGLAGFWGEFFTMLGAWSHSGRGTTTLHVLVVLSAIAGLLAGAYCVRLLRRVWAGGHGPDTEEPIRDTFGAETVVLAVLATAVVVLGVLPTPLLDLTAPAVQTLLGVGR